MKYLEKSMFWQQAEYMLMTGTVSFALSFIAGFFFQPIVAYISFGLLGIVFLAAFMVMLERNIIYAILIMMYAMLIVGIGMYGFFEVKFSFKEALFQASRAVFLLWLLFAIIGPFNLVFRGK